MRVRRSAPAITTTVSFLVGAWILAAVTPAWAGPYPEARKSDQKDDFFGTTIADPYRWMEDTDSPEVQAWVEAENALTRSRLDALPQRPRIVERLTELLDYPRFGIPGFAVPETHGEWVFFCKNDGLQNQSVVYKRKGLAGEPQVLLDPNALSADGTIAINAERFSRDGTLYAYGLSQSGSDWEVIHVKNVASGKDLADKLERVRFTDIAWAADNSGFYYSRYPEDQEHFQKLYFHRIGEPQKKDRLIYERPDDPNLGSSGAVSHDGNWLVVHIWQGTASENEIYVQRLGADTKLQPLFTGFTDSFDFIDAVGERLYFVTNKEAPKRRIVVVDAKDPAHALIEVVPEHATDVISEAKIVDGKLVVASMHNAHDVLRVHGLDGALLQDVEMPTLGSITGLSGSPDRPECFVGFTSFLFPTQSYRLDFDTGKLVLYQKANIQFDAEPYVARQIFYESKDGTKIPLFLVHRRGITLDGNNPVLLYGYGGFNISRTPSFSTAILLWLEQGGVYAMPNLRGGGEFGEEWHRAGMLEKKQNVFDDFISAAEWLIDNGYTRPQRLAIEGGSNGGLLTAVCAVQRPELYGAVLVRVPVIDMLRYQLFTIGSYWMPEYGDPQNPEHFKFLIAYSPLHNVRPGVSYPAMFITTADTDTRVYPAHAKKFAATVQACNVSDKPILLRVETKAGHGAGKPVTKSIDERADLYSFVMDQLGMQMRPAGKSMSTRSSR